jgi:hypothetical protein
VLSNIRARLTYANVMLTILAFFAFGGGAVWANTAATGARPGSRAQGFTKVIKRNKAGTGFAQAKCPAGTWMVGGGGIVTGSGALISSYPFTGPKAGSWQAVSTNPSDGVIAWVLCAS